MAENGDTGEFTRSTPGARVTATTSILENELAARENEADDYTKSIIS